MDELEKTTFLFIIYRENDKKKSKTKRPGYMYEFDHIETDRVRIQIET